jgi:hypothetical protein
MQRKASQSLIKTNFSEKEKLMNSNETAGIKSFLSGFSEPKERVVRKKERTSVDITPRATTMKNDKYDLESYYQNYVK